MVLRRCTSQGTNPAAREMSVAEPLGPERCALVGTQAAAVSPAVMVSCWSLLKPAVGWLIASCVGLAICCCLASMAQWGGQARPRQRRGTSTATRPHIAHAGHLSCVAGDSYPCDPIGEDTLCAISVICSPQHLSSNRKWTRRTRRPGAVCLLAQHVIYAHVSASSRLLPGCSL